MRQKSMKLIVTFPSTAAAMEMERICKERSVPGRLIPVPREITAGCGLSWCAPLEAREELRTLAVNEGLLTGGFFELIV